MTTRNKIGFRYEKEEQVVEPEVPTVPETNEALKTMPISSAHANLLSSINSLANIIASPLFLSYSQEQKNSLVSQLIDFSAINAELTIKTMLLQ